MKEHYIKTAIKGIFWSLPIILIVALIDWLYTKINVVTGEMFKLIGLSPENNLILWTILGLCILGGIAYVIGHFVETNLANYVEKILSHVPGYNTIKDLVNIFNSSKKGEKNVLVVLIRGFSDKGYNVGLMYSTKESIIKNHYTVVLSQTPIPNGGYMFEEHQDNILVLTEAKFDHNLQYLLSMGTKSLPEIMNIESLDLNEIPTLKEYLIKQKLSLNI